MLNTVKFKHQFTFLPIAGIILQFLAIYFTFSIFGFYFQPVVNLYFTFFVKYLITVFIAYLTVFPYILPIYLISFIFLLFSLISYRRDSFNQKIEKKSKIPAGCTHPHSKARSHDSTLFYTYFTLLFTHTILHPILYLTYFSRSCSIFFFQIFLKFP